MLAIQQPALAQHSSRPEVFSNCLLQRPRPLKLAFRTYVSYAGHRTRQRPQVKSCAQQGHDPLSETSQQSPVIPANDSKQDSAAQPAQQPMSREAAEAEQVAARQAAHASASTSAASTLAFDSIAADGSATLQQPREYRWPGSRLLWAVVHFLQGLAAAMRRLPASVQKQKLQRLHAAALEEPDNPTRFLALLRELNKQNSKAVLKHVDSQKFAVNDDVVVEYIKALVATGTISQFSGGAVTRPGQDHKSLSQLLKDLRSRLAAGTAATDRPGNSTARPLHVIVQEAQPKTSGSLGFWSFLQSVFVSFASMVALAVVFLLGASALRKYAGAVNNGSAVTAGGATPAVAAPGMASYAPKEYIKENMPEKSVKTFGDVKGCPEAKAELEEIVEYLKNPAKFTKLGGKLPKGVLLTGEPGTGKTLLARAVAGEAGVPFFYRAGSEFEEMFVGVGSRRVRSLFAAAKAKAPCIIFIDEIDAVGGSRKQWDNNHSKKTLNQLLTEMDGFEANEGIIVMAATNLSETLDGALTRPGRFDRHVAVPLPDVAGRLEILEHYLKDKPKDASVNAARLARQTPGLSGAELSNLVNEAALLAAKNNQPQIMPQMLDEARDRMLMGIARKSMIQTPEARKLTAYHEGGHALVALHTAGAKPIHKATIVPRGHALGMVVQVPNEDEFSMSKRQMLASIDVSMGGKVAEELFFGPDQVTSGATSDLKSATRIAQHMVADCGMSEELGPVYIERDSRSGRVMSSDTARRVDAEVTRMLREAYQRVKALLKGKEHEMHKLAAALLEHETLTQDDIRAVLAGTFQKEPIAKQAAEAEVDEALGSGALPSAAVPTATHSSSSVQQDTVQ